LDLEIARFPDSSLADMVLTASEPPEYRSPDMLQLLFSAKESVYKAAYPSCRRFLEFRDVTIRLDLSRRVFSAIAETENGALARFEPGGGLFEIGNHGVATLFAIPSDTALERPV
jgi:4'-phosphopantetheinyl transferase EntD